MEDVAELGYAAFAVGVLYTLPSVYWAVGGALGLRTLGGQLEAMGYASEPTAVALASLAAGLKLVAAALGLAAVRAWGRRLPRRPFLAMLWSAAAILVLYGGTLTSAEALVQIGIIGASTDMDWYAFHWHLFVWDPWFLFGVCC